MNRQGVCKKTHLNRWSCKIDYVEGVGPSCDSAITSAATKMILEAAKNNNVDISRHHFGERVKLDIVVLQPFHKDEHRAYDLILPVFNSIQAAIDVGDA
jgi:hypothetical protein